MYNNSFVFVIFVSYNMQLISFSMRKFKLTVALLILFFLLQMPETLFQNTLKCLVNIVSTETATLAAFGMQALGHIGLRVSLPPLVNNSDSGEVIPVSVVVKCQNFLSVIICN